MNEKFLVYGTGKRIPISWRVPKKIASKEGQEFCEELWQLFMAASKKERG